tara:strand:+ start:651 stop:3068 length:2418 start_codon:yes stop_codon:yes gene_type:complete
MRITKSLKLSFILGVLFAFHLTCSSDFGEPGELGSISFDIIFNNDSSQSSKQSHDLIDPVKDVINITKAKSVSSDITGLTITIPDVDTVDITIIWDGSPVQTISETIDGVPVGQQTIRVDLKNIAGTILYTQTQTVQVLSGETSSPSFSAEDFSPENQFIDVISPNGGELWEIGSEQVIEWNSPHSSLRVHIFIQPVQQPSIAQLIAENELNDGLYTWEISTALLAETNYRVKIQVVDDVSVYDESNGPFTLFSPPSFITLTSPNGGEVWLLDSTYDITWNSDSPSANVKIYLMDDIGYVEGISIGEYDTLTSTQYYTIMNNGTYSWTIQQYTAGGTVADYNFTPGIDYKVKIFYELYPEIFDESDDNFIIEGGLIPGQPGVIVTSPNGGENWELGSTQNITWISSNVSGNVKIDLYKSGISWFISPDESNDGSYSWDLSSALDAGMDYTVRISSVNDTSVYDESDEDFTLYNTSTISWMQTGLTSGNVNDLAINSQGHIFAGVYSNLWRSVDFGATWQITGDFDANGINQGDQRIAITESDRILVTEGTSIRISDDNGITWSYANMVTNHSFERVESIAIAPNGSIYAGRVQDWGCTTCGIFKSTDGGNNFSWVFQAPYEDEAFVRFAFKPDGQIFVGSTSWGDHTGQHQMYRSIDDGSSWNYADTGLQGLVQDLIITPLGRILVNMAISPSLGFFASDDDGSSWYQIGGGDPIERFDGGLVIDNNNTIYAFKYLWGSPNGELGYQSIDDGDSWAPISEAGLVDFDNDHTPYCSLITPSQFIFIGTGGGGVIRTMAPVTNFSEN